MVLIFFFFIHSWLCLFNSFLKSPMAVCVNLLCTTTTWSIVISIQFNPLNSPMRWILHVTEEEIDIGRGQTQLITGKARAWTQVWFQNLAYNSLWPTLSKAWLKFMRWKIIPAPFEPPHTLLNKNRTYPIITTWPFTYTL